MIHRKGIATEASGRNDDTLENNTIICLVCRFYSTPNNNGENMGKILALYRQGRKIRTKVHLLVLETELLSDIVTVIFDGTG